MTSPAGGIAGAPYRGASWTQGYPAQQAYRYTAPIPQPTYAYTPQTQQTTVSNSKNQFKSITILLLLVISHTIIYNLFEQ